MNSQIAIDFVAAINAHDIEKMIMLMAVDHVFVDAYGNIASKEMMIHGWPGYFSWFPDYLIEIDEILENANTIALFGYASGTYHGETTADNKNYWRIPVAWRVIVENGLIKSWQVYADSKIPFDIMNDNDKCNGV